MVGRKHLVTVDMPTHGNSLKWCVDIHVGQPVSTKQYDCWQHCSVRMRSRQGLRPDSVCQFMPNARRGISRHCHAQALQELAGCWQVQTSRIRCAASTLSVANIKMEQLVFPLFILVQTCSRFKHSHPFLGGSRKGCECFWIHLAEITTITSQEVLQHRCRAVPGKQYIYIGPAQ